MEHEIRIEVSIRENGASEPLKTYFWNAMTEDELLVKRIMEKSPFVGVRTVLRQIEHQHEEEDIARRKFDELAHDMTMLYDAIRISGEPIDGGRLRAKEDVVRGVLFARKFDTKKCDEVLSRALEAETIARYEKYILMMKGI